MVNVSNDFINYSKAPGRQSEEKVVINGVTYLKDSIVKLNIGYDILYGDEFTLGEVISNKLVLQLKTNDVIGENATIETYQRLNGVNGWSEWVPLGVFYIDNRKNALDVWTFECYDRLIFTNQTYVTDLVFPISMQEVVEDIALQLSVSLDSSIAIPSTYMVPYKDEDITINQMLRYISMAVCASVKMTRDNKLAFVVFSSNTAVADITPSEYIKATKLNNAKTYTRLVITYDDDGNSYEVGSGIDDNTLKLYNPYIDNEDILADMLSTLSTFSYVPFTMNWRMRAYLEPGDIINITLITGEIIKTVILRQSMSLKGGLIGVSEAPCLSVQGSEFKFEGSLASVKRDVANSVKLDKRYFGVSIGRAYGLKIEASDESSEVILNSETFTFRGLKNGTMTDRVYWDATQGNYVFDGILSADAIAALTLSAEKGYITELTVDQIDTSTKIKKYLDEDTGIVSYWRGYDQFIEFIEATVALPVDIEQARSRDGDLLFWADATTSAVTIEETDWPVFQYIYNELVKLKIYHEVDPITGSAVPKMVWGAGTGVDDNGKGYIYKDDDEMIFSYKTTTGIEYSIRITESGIVIDGLAYELTALNIASDSFQATYGSVVYNAVLTKDETGRITSIDTGTRLIPITYNEV